MSTDVYNIWHSNTWTNIQQSDYVLPIVPNVCSYTTLGKDIANFYVFNNQYDTIVCI